MDSSSIEDFQNKKYKSDHQLVIILITKTTTQESIENAQEMFEFYAKAPITLCFMDETVNDQIELSEDLTNLVLDEEPKLCATLTEIDSSVIDRLKNAFEMIKEYEDHDIKPAFAKYDADNSGNISIDELKVCLEDLGYELADEKIS